MIVGCAGGGSNYAGIAFPIGQKLRGESDLRIVAGEPAAGSSLTKGKFAYDFGDTAHMTPLVKMHTHGTRLYHEVSTWVLSVKPCVVRRKDGVKQFFSPMWTWPL